MDTSAGIPFTQWFPGARLNAYDSAVVRYRRTDPDRLALIGETEGGATRRLTYAELEDAVERTAAGLHAIGVARGVAVGLYLPLVIENAVALLACTKLGAVAVPLFSGFGAEAIRQRLADADAKVLITADAAIRRGRTVPMLPVAAQAADGLPQLERLVVVNCAGFDAPRKDNREVPWDQIVRSDRDRVPTQAMASDEPLMLLYTSGTTGRPKGTVPGHAGLPIKSAQDWALGMDVRPGERVMWITAMGWVMGPLLVFGSLMIGGTAVFYDGAPDHPNPARIWDVAERQGVTHLGISPTLTRVLMASGERAAPSQPIPGLRVLASTGEPWTPEAWTWLFEVVGRGRVPIMNYSGGTECGGGTTHSGRRETGGGLRKWKGRRWRGRMGRRPPRSASPMRSRVSLWSSSRWRGRMPTRDPSPPPFLAASSGRWASRSSRRPSMSSRACRRPGTARSCGA